MKRHIATLISSTLVLAALRAEAQHEGHSTVADPPPVEGPAPELVTACIEAQRNVSALAEGANARIEAARQTNSLQEMRAAISDLQAALVEIRTRASECAALQDAAPPADPHAGHGMAPSEMPSAESVDPVCSMKVDAQTAPRAAHEGDTYYFCSEEHRELFLKDPEKYRKPIPR